MGKKEYRWLLVTTGLLLLVPLIAMQLTDEVRWNLMDFLVMGVLVFCAGSLFIIISKKFKGKHRFFLFALITIIFLYIWAELAVGIFT